MVGVIIRVVGLTHAMLSPWCITTAGQGTTLKADLLGDADRFREAEGETPSNK